MARRHYQNPPITEAVIDLQTIPPDNIEVADLEPFCAAERDRYPHSEQLATMHAEFQAKIEADRLPEASAKVVESSAIGYRQWSPDRLQVFQARLNGFAFSRLAPYANWEEFATEALRLWEAYCSCAGPQEVHRIAVRYINRIELPTPVADFEAYFRTFAQVSAELSQGLSAAFIRLQIPYDDPAALLNLTIATINQECPDRLPILLDIDLVQTGTFDVDVESLATQLELLHKRENDIFEACITDTTRRLFD